MKTKTDCITCMFSDLVGAIRAEKLDEKLGLKILQTSLRFLSENFSENEIPSYYITQIHRIFKDLSKIEIPFAATRKKSNILGKKIAQKILDNLDNTDDQKRFSQLIRWSVAANSIDFRTAGISYNFSFAELEEGLSGVFRRGLYIDETKKIYQLVKKAKNILFVPDNVGEIAMDKIFIQEMRKHCDEVTVALRGGPITSDATWEDGKQVNIFKAAKKVILTGGDTLGVLFPETHPDFKKALNSADLIFTKGQANYYAFSEYKNKIRANIICLFTTKCDIVSEIFGAKGKVSITKIL